MIGLCASMVGIQATAQRTAPPQAIPERLPHKAPQGDAPEPESEITATSQVARDFLARANRARIQKLWLERRMAMQRDSERLAGLANQLQQQVLVGTDPRALPADAIRNAEEIERLAKRLRTNLRGPI